MSIPTEKGDDKLREAVSKDETRAEWGGAAVVFGLGVEVALTAAYRHGESAVEVWAPSFATALVTLGVAAEILFARKARAKSEVLHRRSQEKVAEAEARAAEAIQKAEEERHARVKLEAKIAPRQLSSEQIAVLSQELKGKIPKLYLWVCDDLESQQYARQFFTALHAMDLIVIKGNQAGMVFSQQSFGLSGIHAFLPPHEGDPDGMANVRDPLVQALLKSGMAVGVTRMQSNLSPIYRADWEPGKRVLAIGEKPIATA